MSRYRKGLVLAAILSLAVTACSSGDKTPQGKEGGTVNAFLSEPDSLDPALATTTTSSEVLNTVFDPLIHYNPTTLEPEFTGAAESVEVNDDATILTFKLREGAKFHDGSDVTAEDFVRSLTRAALKETASDIAYHIDGIKGFMAAQTGKSNKLSGVHEGANPLELVIELEETNAEFFVRTGHLIFSPVPEQAVGDTKAFNEQPIGNGPYKMKGKWKHNRTITVEKFDDYNGEQKGFLDEINWEIILEIETGYLEFQGGTLDTADVPPEQLTDAAATFGDGFIDVAVVISAFLWFDNTSPPTDNKLVRQAISRAIDREAINQAVFAGQRTPAASFIPPGNSGYREGVCTHCVFDAAEAKRLLEESGVDVKKLDITFNSGGGHQDWIAAVAAQLEENLGVQVKITPGPEDFGDYLKGVKATRPNLFRYGWAQDYPTPDNWLGALMYSTAGDNYGKYKNPAYDAKIDEARRTIDAAARLKLYNEAEDIAIEDMPMVPIYYYKAAKVYNTEKFAEFVLGLQYGDPIWRLISLKS